MNVSGKFDIKLNPLETYAKSKDDIQLGRLSIDKTFHGQLNATSQGEMLNAVSPIKGSAGYVALELVSGELDGKKGSFALQHYGTMGNGQQNLILEVVPGTGVGELKGLSGKMAIDIADGQHLYSFEYELSDVGLKHL
jgi:hypothetical protein